MAERRAHIERAPDGVRVEISPERARWQPVAHALLVLAPAAGLVVVVAAGAGPLFGLSLALGLLISVLAAAQVFLAREVISLSGGELVLETATWPWRYSRRFDRARVEHLRTEAGGAGGRQPDLELRAFSSGTIAFDYDGRVYRFGAQLAEAESRSLVELLAAY
jgi:hypothetical protein